MSSNYNKNTEVVLKNETMRDIEQWWEVSVGWDALPYEKKLEHYWKYVIRDGKRVHVTDEDYK